MNPLSDADFPLFCVGTNIYRRTASSPVIIAPSDAIAADICERLNWDHSSSGGEQLRNRYQVTPGPHEIRQFGEFDHHP